MLLRLLFQLLHVVLSQPAPDRWGWDTRAVALYLVTWPSVCLFDAATGADVGPGTAVFGVVVGCYILVRCLLSDALEERIDRETAEIRAEDEWSRAAVRAEKSKQG